MRRSRLAALPWMALLVVALAALVASGAGGAPVAMVTMSGPEEVVVEPGREAVFQMHLSARLECARGFDPPRDLLVSVAPAGTDLWHVSPAVAAVPWKAAPAEPNVFLIDALVTFNVSSDAEPNVPTTSETKVFVKEARDAQPRLHCHVDGYELQMEEHAVAFVVMPEEDAETAVDTVGERPPVRWLPISLAVGILAALTVFATVRERTRRCA